MDFPPPDAPPPPPRNIKLNETRTDPNFLCHGSVLREQERVQCIVPVLVWDQAETEASVHAGEGLGAPASGRSGTAGHGGDKRERPAAGAGRQRLLAGGGDGPGAVGEEEEEVEAEEASTAGVSLSVGGRGAVWEGGVEYTPRRCDSVEDCDDGDACSFDACVKVWREGGRFWRE